MEVIFSASYQLRGYIAYPRGLLINTTYISLPLDPLPAFSITRALAITAIGSPASEITRKEVTPINTWKAIALERRRWQLVPKKQWKQMAL